jgi:sulfide:quinone oxidoreductase
MNERVLILGAGFGGLELSTMLSEAMADDIDVTLIDKSDAFVFGFSKLDLMFGRTTRDRITMPYADIAKPGVRVVHETVTAIDPESKRVSTDAGTHEADRLVIALGADYDMDATPGLAEGANEFYSVAGAEQLAEVIPTFSRGHVVIGVCGAPFKCPPAPSECALLLHEELTKRGVRDECQISFILPLPSPVPPSPETSAALAEAFGQRNIALIAGRGVTALDPAGTTALLDDGTEVRFDLFLGVPRHRAPDVVIASGMAEDGYIPVDPGTLKTRFPNVWALGDVATAGVPKAGVFAEGAARVVARTLIHELRGGEEPGRHLGQGTCYIEFGDGRVGSVDIDFLSGPSRTGTFNPPSAALVAEKERFGSSRRARWFGN